jgi:SagB-type dehydrogenase family enzyme
MKKIRIISIAIFFAMITTGCGNASQGGDTTGNIEGKLPQPKIKGRISVEQTMNERKSVRSFQDKPLSVEQVSQLLWAAQGVTHSWGERLFRTAPSAGATYPLETYLFTASGVYKYIPKDHSLIKVLEDDLRKKLSDASLGQTAVSDAHAVFVFTMIEERTAQRYGERAFRYICMEAGHVAQNIHLQAVALGLGSVPVGAFDDNQVSEILKCNEGEVPIYIVPVGYETMEE